MGQLRKYFADEEAPLAEYLQRLAMVTDREDIERCMTMMVQCGLGFAGAGQNPQQNEDLG